MRSTFFIFCSILVLLFTSCKKDEATINPLQQNPSVKTVQPIKDLIEKTSFVDTLVNFYGGTHELGIRFKSANAGTIHQVGLKTPLNEKFTVTIWDMSTKEVLRTVSVNTVANQYIYQNIDKLDIQVNKEYVISFNTFNMGEAQRFYQARKKSGNKLYPFTSHGIQFLDFRYMSGSETKFPIGVAEHEQDLIPGILDFSFEITSGTGN